MIEKAIFIGGCARAGTTLLGAMLGGHSSAICVPESQFKIGLLRDSRIVDRDGALKFLRNHWRFKLWNMPVNPEELPDSGSVDRTGIIHRLCEMYGARHNRGGRSVWVDHTPHNIRHCKLLADRFPDSKFIHIIRDGRGVAASVIPLDWGPNNIIEAAHFWIEQTAYGLAAEDNFGPERIHRVHYEQLVTEPESVMKSLSAFIGWEFEPSLLEGNGFTPPGYTAHQHKLVGQRPDPSRINAWKNKFSPRDHEIFESLTEDFLDYLGYERMFDFPTRPATAMEKLRIKTAGIYRKEITNRIRGWMRRHQ
jgi:hypothetical protein